MAQITELIKRTTNILYLAQIALLSAIGIFVAFGTVVIFDLSGRHGFSALLLGVYNVGAAAGAFGGGRGMAKFGRRNGLLVGYALMTVGALLTLFSINLENAEMMLASAIVIGSGSGVAMLGRAAIADMNKPEVRGRAVGSLILVGTIGAVGGPILASYVQLLLSENTVISPSNAPWTLIIIMTLFAFSMIFRMKVDPSRLALETISKPENTGDIISSEPANGQDPSKTIVSASGPGREPKEILLQRPALLALAMISISQAIMVIFMGAIPTNIHQHGEAQSMVSAVVSLHLAGMFIFSRVIGKIMDKKGRRIGLHGGAIITGSGLLIAILIPGTLASATGLFLIGVGWSAAYIGSTTIFSDVTKVSERSQTLGTADLFVALSSAVGIFLGAILLEFTSFKILASISLSILSVLALLLFFIKENAPGQWQGIR